MPTTTSRGRHGEVRLTERILEQLLRLVAADALTLHELPEAPGVHRTTFRAAGWPVQIDLDETVLEIRVYSGRETISTGRVPPRVMAALLGRTEVRSDTPASADDGLAALRAIVAEWRGGNARVFMEPPRVAGHPDRHNNA